MTDSISITDRRLSERRDALWSQLQTTWLEVPLRENAGSPSPTWADFSERFDRCFRGVCDHVNGRVRDHEALRRIVTRVLVDNMDLFIAQRDTPGDLERLRASADRLLAREAATRPGAVTFSAARDHRVGAVRSDERGHGAITMSPRILRWSWASIVAAAALLLSMPAWAVARPDAWITTKTKISLLTTEGVSGTAINVDTTDGRVTLHGIVSSEQEKTTADQLARDIEGVRDVRNLLQVVPAAAKATTTVSDADLKARVTLALEQDTTLADSRIRVESVNAGVVLLEGSAKTLSDHRRAIEDAARVDGATRVESNIESPDELADAEIWQDGGYDAAKAEGSAARDMWITSAAKMRLMANSETPALEINVDTSDGIVTLFGSVPSEQVKQAASEEVRKVGGVQSVNNQLEVVAEADSARVAEKDSDVKSAIESRLDARGELEDADIDVEVSNGVARLTGSVDSQSDRMTALTVARGTSGVRAVLDELELNPPAVSSR